LEHGISDLWRQKNSDSWAGTVPGKQPSIPEGIEERAALERFLPLMASTGKLSVRR
jgi:hypothetical protein